MNTKMAISTLTDLKQASDAINTLSPNAKLQFRVKTDANGVKTLHVRALTDEEKLKLKISGGYSRAQKNAAFSVIKDIVDQTYPDLHITDKFKPEVKAMLKLYGAILHNVSLSNMEAGVRLKPKFSDQIKNQIFDLQSKINPSTLGRGLDD